MLIEFSVSNYRSFREKQTFSMVATPRLAKKGNVFKPDIKGDKIPDLLKVAAIYGPNASGKSNLIKALGLIYSLINQKSSELSNPLPVSPFRFDKSLASQPSRFEIHFISYGLRYEFEIAATPDRIVEERLVAYPRGKEALLYSRRYTSTGEEYTFGEMLEGGSTLHDAWRKLTSPKMLFIKQAVLNSNEELTQLKKPFDWLNTNISPVPSELNRVAKITLSIANSNIDLGLQKFIASFLHEVDIPITAVTLEQKNEETEYNQTEDDNKKYVINELKDEKVASVVRSMNKIKATFTHKTELGEAEFDFNEESDGTKNLVGFCLPWMLLSNHSNTISTIVIDELDSSLHPKIVANLINKLLSFEMPVQMIFTTHDTHLMDTKLLRRDQLWLTERDINGATQLRSVHDFEGRESEDVEKRYYEGRYRGLPIV